MEILDVIHGNHDGYIYLVRKMIFPPSTWEPEGYQYYCGYVAIPKGHRLYKAEYNGIDISCHGGLTFSDFIKGEWFIGFDCHHIYDDPMIQDENYTARECKYIIDQITRGDLA